MLPAKYSIRKQKEIENIFQHGTAFFCKILGVKTIKNKFQHPRFVVIVSNKISKKAVERNKIKRRIKSVINSLLPELKTNKDCAIISLSLINNANYNEIKKAIQKAFKKQHLI